MMQFLFFTFLFLHCIIISGIHHQECIAPNVDISLQSGRFLAMSVASFRERLLDFRSCWIVFIHVVRGHPDCLVLQFSKGGAVKIFLASVSSGIHAMWLNREKRRAWTIAKRCGCLAVHLTSSFHTFLFALRKFFNKECANIKDFIVSVGLQILTINLTINR